MSLENESNLGVSISDQTLIIKNTLNDWASENQGICIVCENIEEKLLTGFSNVIGPKILVQFIGEESIGDESVQELLGHVRRSFDILVQRGKVLSDPRNTALTTITGPSRPFYNIVEEIRDKIRCIIWPSPMTTNPTEYHGIRPFENGNWLLDSYVINVSIVTQIGRVQATPGALGGGNGNDWVQLSDSLPQPSTVP